MNNLKELFKSRKFIFCFSLLFTLLIIIIRMTIFENDDYIELLFLPILSLLWGPFAVLGFAIVELPYTTIFDNQNIIINLTNIILILVCGNILWKLWYSIMNKYEYNIPNLGNSYNIIKLFIIFIIYMLINFILFQSVVFKNMITDYTYIYLELFAPLSIFFTIFILHIANMFKIPLYSPRIQFRKILPEKVYAPLLILSLAIGLLVNSAESDILILLVAIMYIIKPLNEEVFKIKGTIDLNLFNKVTISIFFILFVLSLILVFTPYLDLMKNLSIEIFIDFSNTLTILFVLFLIPVFIYMIFLERKVIKPINIISKSLSHEINTQKDFEKLKNNLTSINTNNEIKSLADSLLKMENELIDYGKELVKVTSEKERFETELKLANDIQMSMIPKEFDEINEQDCEIRGMMKAAREVGGDFYDYFKIDDENIGFVIGDVSGKGITASLTMVKAITLIEDHAKHYSDVSKVFYEVNNLLCEGNAENHFVTCWLGKINLKTKELSFVNAGHNPPLIKNNSESFEYLKCDSDVVLAIMEDMDYETHTIQLSKGSSLFLYTDGVTEANNNYKGFYGEERLSDILNQNKEHELNDIINNIERDINEFCDNEEQFDDMTMLLIKLL